MRISIIAPTSNLDSNGEIVGIVNGYESNIVKGPLGRDSLERALKDATDILHFIGHGDKGLLALDGEVLDAADFVTMLAPQRGSVKMVFLNACNSLSTGTLIHNYLHSPVIAHDASIEDKAAVHFARAFYRRYRQCQNVQEAFDTAIQSLQRMYPAQAVIPQLINGDMSTESEIAAFMSYVKDSIEGMDAKLTTIETTVNGLKAHTNRTLLVLLGLLLLAQLATPLLNSLLIH